MQAIVVVLFVGVKERKFIYKAHETHRLVMTALSMIMDDFMGGKQRNKPLTGAYYVR